MKLLFLLFKGATLGKLLLSGGTMLLSVATYALAFGWPYATGFVVLLFCHELGHYLAARQRNLPVGLPMFIPFVGAWVALKEEFPDAERRRGSVSPVPCSARLPRWAATIWRSTSTVRC